MPSCAALHRLSSSAKLPTQIRTVAKKKYNAKQLTTLAPYNVRHLHLATSFLPRVLRVPAHFESHQFSSPLSRKRNRCVLKASRRFRLSPVCLCLCECLLAWCFGIRSMGAFYAFVLITNLFVALLCVRKTFCTKEIAKNTHTHIHTRFKKQFYRSRQTYGSRYAGTESITYQKDHSASPQDTSNRLSCPLLMDHQLNCSARYEHNNSLSATNHHTPGKSGFETVLM